MTAEVDVHVEIDGADIRVGRLYAHRRRGTESASFSYDEAYLADPRAFALDPQLSLVAGLAQSAVGLPLFRAFADSSPDRWGRNLLRRRERLRAQDAGPTARSLGEFELLLGVRDDLRQGAVRFRRPSEAEFLAPDGTGVPALTDLPSLLGAADRLATDDADHADLVALVIAGSSLGGARPKAHVRLPDGALAIAKFPSPASDSWNVMAWEKTALDLARGAGLDVPDSELIRIDRRDVLLVKRFDRRGDRRVGYCSAMTMLESTDGDVRSYLDIAAALEERSGRATADLHELWRRIAFSVLITNTDDHLRNHGFLHSGGDTWSLSPAFDLNPTPTLGARYLSTAIIDDDVTASVENVMAVADAHRLGRAEAHRVLGEVVDACLRWRTVAAAHGIPRSELAALEPAFEHAEFSRAREITRR